MYVLPTFQISHTHLIIILTSFIITYMNILNSQFYFHMIIIIQIVNLKDLSLTRLVLYYILLTLVSIDLDIYHFYLTYIYPNFY